MGYNQYIIFPNIVHQLIGTNEKAVALYYNRKPDRITCVFSTIVNGN